MTKEELALRERIQNRGPGSLGAFVDYIYKSCLLDMNGPMGLAALAIVLVREGKMDGKPIDVEKLVRWSRCAIETGAWGVIYEWVEQANADLTGDDDG